MDGPAARGHSPKENSVTTVVAPDEHRDAGARRYREARKVAIASFVGTTAEWYDFFLYGAAAALVFGPQYFPAHDPVVSQLAALGSFAVGFVARPFGGILAGHFGDRFGRKMLMVISLIVMGVASVAVGLLPTYAQIGVGAPAILVFLRIVQGLGVGANWGGAALLAVEHAPPNRRGLYGAAVQLGIPAGALLSTLVLFVAASLTDRDSFAAWGWRIGFIASVGLIAFALMIRRMVGESPLFEEATKQAPAGMPLLQVARRHPWAVVRSLFATAASTAIGYIILVFVLSYGTSEIHYARATLLWVVSVTSVVQMFAIYGWSALSDRVGCRRVMVGGALGQVAVALVFFPLFDTGRVALALLVCILGVIVNSAQYGPLPALISRQFPVQVRYTGVSLGYQLGNVVGGGLAPVIATALFAATKNSQVIGYYLALMALFTIVAVAMSPQPSADPPAT